MSTLMCGRDDAFDIQDSFGLSSEDETRVSSDRCVRAMQRQVRAIHKMLLYRPYC